MSDDPDCIGMCAIDGEFCSGCGRTLDQINAARGGEDEPETASPPFGAADDGQRPMPGRSM